MSKRQKKRIVLALILAGLILAGGCAAAKAVTLRPATGETSDAKNEEEDRIGRYAAGAEVTAEEPEEPEIFERYVEGEGPAPEWYDPTEPMAAEWVANDRQMTETNNEAGSGDSGMTSGEAQQVTAEAHPPEGVDAGGIDWNLCTSRTGWDGHRAEIWELDLMSRVFYLEFWQPDLTLCEAGCDAILRLWESGEKGATLGEVLSSTAENGAWTYSVYPEVWATKYDPDGLAWCRAYCEQRFTEGPEWIAPYFRLDCYHDWAIPAYQIGNVYFSVGGGTDGEG